MSKPLAAFILSAMFSSVCPAGLASSKPQQNQALLESFAKNLQRVHVDENMLFRIFRFLQLGELVQVGPRAFRDYFRGLSWQEARKSSGEGGIQTAMERAVFLALTDLSGNSAAFRFGLLPRYFCLRGDGLVWSRPKSLLQAIDHFAAIISNFEGGADESIAAMNNSYRNMISLGQFDDFLRITQIKYERAQMPASLLLLCELFLFDRVHTEVRCLIWEAISLEVLFQSKARIEIKNAWVQGVVGGEIWGDHENLTQKIREQLEADGDKIDDLKWPGVLDDIGQRANKKVGDLVGFGVSARVATATDALVRLGDRMDLWTDLYNQIRMPISRHVPTRIFSQVIEKMHYSHEAAEQKPSGIDQVKRLVRAQIRFLLEKDEFSDFKFAEIGRRDRFIAALKPTIYFAHLTLQLAMSVEKNFEFIRAIDYGISKLWIKQQLPDSALILAFLNTQRSDLLIDGVLPEDKYLIDRHFRLLMLRVESSAF